MLKQFYSISLLLAFISLFCLDQRRRTFAAGVKVPAILSLNIHNSAFSLWRFRQFFYRPLPRHGRKHGKFISPKLSDGCLMFVIKHSSNSTLSLHSLKKFLNHIIWHSLGYASSSAHNISTHSLHESGDAPLELFYYRFSYFMSCLT